MQDGAAEDKTDAQAIRDALAKLNDALKRAAQVGLHVDIEVHRGHGVGCSVPLVICMAKIERRSAL